MSNRRPPLALIAGPTASGKSALALALAERCNGVIVNADSAQVYRDLPILSAAPSAAERARAEHRLYGVRDGADPCSAADWAAMARREIAGIQADERLPILVGGTGLYLRTLLDGIAPVPAIDPVVRAEVRAAAVEHNHQRLAALDPPSAAGLAPSDSTRVARALEVMLSTGQPMRHWQARRAGGIGEEVALRALALLPPRDWLYRRCDERFAQMMAAGAIEEVRQLMGRGLDPRLPVMRAIGVREVIALLAGDMDEEAAIRAGQQATRNYAKRQYTWFANQPPAAWRRLAEPLEGDAAAAALELLGASA